VGEGGVTWLWAFVATAAADFCWTRYLKACAEGRPWVASLWSASIVAVGGVLTLTLVESSSNILPAMAGAIVGTRLAFYYDDEAE
jgi:hypothetical protein